MAREKSESLSAAPARRLIKLRDFSSAKGSPAVTIARS
jgi:hypothetical protein